MDRTRSRVALAHGAFNVATGLWPVFDIHSFERVTGPKVDRWLVKTVGLLLAVIGVSEILAARRGEVPPSVAELGTGTALALAGIDVVYSAKRRISAMYALDALMQGGWVAAWRLTSRTGS